MKRLFLLTVFSFLVLWGFGQTPSIKVYGGVQFNGTSSTDFENFDISDWERFGLVSQNSSSAEGRVRVPLGDVDASGLKLGIRKLIFRFLMRQRGILSLSVALFKGSITSSYCKKVD